MRWRCCVWLVPILGVVAGAAGWADVVVFSDAGLESAVREAISKPIGDVTDADLIGLTELNASWRAIAGLDGIQHCPNLVHLYLDHNALADLSGIEALALLEELDVSFNQIASLEPAGGLTHLTKLYAASNQIASLSPVQALAALQQLVVSKNLLTALTGIESLKALTQLDVSSNQLMSLSPVASLSGLAYLTASRNKVITLAGVDQLGALQWLDVLGNQILSLGALHGLSQLQWLDAAWNQISTLSGATGLTGLRTCLLSHNLLDSLDGIAEMPQVQTLDVSANQITSFTDLEGLAALQYLFAADNKVPNLASLMSMTGLKGLRIDGNYTGNIESILKGFTNLEWLGVASNQVSSVTALFDPFKLRLKYLVLRGGAFPDIYQVGAFKQLVALRIEHAQVSALDFLPYLPNLQALGLYDNDVRDLRLITQTPNLTYLDLSSNQLTTLSALPAFTNLGWLDVSDNLVEDVEPLLNSDMHFQFGFDPSEMTRLRLFFERPWEDILQLPAVNLSCNPLSDDALTTQLPAIADTGVTVANDTKDCMGSITVALGPTDAVTAGAQWRIDNGLWHNTNDVLDGFAVGSHVLSFKDLGVNWQTPADVTVVIRANQLKQVNVTYLPPPEVTVPDVVGLAITEAQSAIAAAGLVVSQTQNEYSESVTVNHVIRQDPAAEASVLRGSGVALVVSQGRAPVTVPTVVGLAQDAAISAITGAHLTLGAITNEYNDSVPDGHVISQDPAANASAPPDTPVDLVVSKGPEPVSVPSVIGMIESAAMTEIVHAGLAVGSRTLKYQIGTQFGEVIGQDPPGGTLAPRNSMVSLTVSQGPPPVNVPNVVGLIRGAARSALQDLGLVEGAITTQYSGIVAANYVISQEPSAGMPVPAGSSVNLVLSLGPQPVTVPNVVGMTQEAAAAALGAAGLLAGNTSLEHSDSIPDGYVIRQDPLPGTSAFAGSGVALVLSQGPAPCTAPGTPGNVSASAGDYSDRVLVTWDPVAGGNVQYQVLRAETDNVSSALAVSDWIAATQWSDTDALPATALDSGCGMTTTQTHMYYYWVNARIKAGCEAQPGTSAVGYRGAAKAAVAQLGNVATLVAMALALGRSRAPRKRSDGSAGANQRWPI